MRRRRRRDSRSILLNWIDIRIDWTRHGNRRRRKRRHTCWPDVRSMTLWCLICKFCPSHDVWSGLLLLHLSSCLQRFRENILRTWRAVCEVMLKNPSTWVRLFLGDQINARIVFMWGEVNHYSDWTLIPNNCKIPCYTWESHDRDNERDATRRAKSNGINWRIQILQNLNLIPIPMRLNSISVLVHCTLSSSLVYHKLIWFAAIKSFSFGGWMDLAVHLVV